MEGNQVDLVKKVIINDVIIEHIRWKESASKHFIETAKYLEYIVKTLDGVEHLPSFIDNNGLPFYKTASATSSIIPEYACGRFRDSCFRILKDDRVIEFFHLGYIKNEKKYKLKIKEIIERKSI